MYIVQYTNLKDGRMKEDTPKSKTREQKYMRQSQHFPAIQEYRQDSCTVMNVI
jgi:hypothetical protein